MLTPFEYQIYTLNDLRAAWASGKRRLLLCMLMGAGKTLIAMELMRLASAKGKRCLFICDRRMLAKQALERGKEQGLDCGLVMAGHGMKSGALCQFASKQTIESWLKSGKLVLGDFDIIVIDECHRAVSEKWIELFKRWPKATIFGLTATPCLGNGDGMGAYYEYLCQPIKPSGLRDLGRIVPVRAFAPHCPDLKGIKKDATGDYSAKSLSQRMNRANLIGDVCGWWKKLAEGRPSIYFACDVAHAMSIRDEFRAQDVPAELICDETPDEEREEIRKALESGKIKVVVNCDVLAEGIDWPFVSCIGLVRPTKRLRRYLQNAGRGMRSYPGKKDCLLIDHAGCVLFHGFPDIDREWPLDPRDNIDKMRQAKPNEPKPMQCAKCHAVFVGSRKCPECGHVHAWAKTAKDYAQKNGTLIEVNGDELPEDTKTLLYQRFWGVCIGVAIKNNRRAGAAAGMFSGKFGIPPWQAKVHPLPACAGDWKLPAHVVFPGFVRARA